MFWEVEAVGGEEEGDLSKLSSTSTSFLPFPCVRPSPLHSSSDMEPLSPTELAELLHLSPGPDGEASTVGQEVVIEASKRLSIVRLASLSCLSPVRQPCLEWFLCSFSQTLDTDRISGQEKASYSVSISLRSFMRRRRGRRLDRIESTLTAFRIFHSSLVS